MLRLREREGEHEDLALAQRRSRRRCFASIGSPGVKATSTVPGAGEFPAGGRVAGGDACRNATRRAARRRGDSAPDQRAVRGSAAKKPSQPCRCGIELQARPGVERDAGARELAAALPARELRMRARGTRRRSPRSPRAARCTSRRRGGRRASPASRPRRGSPPASRASSATAASALPPLEIGIAPQRAEAGARRVDQHAVDLAGEPLDLARRARSAISCGCTLDSPERASRGFRLARRFADDVERVEPPLRAHQRAQQQRLAAGAGAEVDDHVAAPRRDQVADELAAFVLHFDRAVGEQRVLRERRPAGDAQAERRVRRRRRRRCLSPRARRSAASRVVFSGLTRRSSGAGASHARASASRSSSPSAAPRRVPQPVGQVGGDRRASGVVAGAP